MDRVKRTFIIALICIVSLITTQDCAQAQEESGVKEPASWYARPEAESTVRYEFPSSASAMGGRLDITDWETECSQQIKIMGELPVDLGIEMDYMSINNALPVKLPSNLVGWSASVGTAVPIFIIPDAYIGCEVYPGFYSDDWDFEASAFRMPQAYFLAYKPDEHWTFAGGVGVAPRYDYNVFPVFSVTYKPNDKITFEVSSQRPNITYKISENWSCYIEGRYEENEYLVDRGDDKKVVLLQREILMGGGIEYKLNKYIRGAISTGGAIDRYFKYRDGNGKVCPDSCLYAEARVMVNI